MKITPILSPRPEADEVWSAVAKTSYSITRSGPLMPGPHTMFTTRSIEGGLAAPGARETDPRNFVFDGCGRDSLCRRGCGGSRPGQRFQLGDHRRQSVTVERIAVQGLGMQHKLAALGLGGRGRHRQLAAELVRRSGLALADAFDLAGVQRIDFGLPRLYKLTLKDWPNPRGQIEAGGFVDSPLEPKDSEPSVPRQMVSVFKA